MPASTAILVRIFLTFVLACVAGSCATSPGRYSDTSDTLDEDAFAALIGELRPQSLNAGQCGLFLWSRSEQRSLVFFGLGNRSEGRMMIAEQEVSLRRTEAEGQMSFGHFPQQTYERGDIAVRLSLDIEPRPNLAGGAVVPNGSLRFEQKGGWNLVMPVGGLIACQPN